MKAGHAVTTSPIVVALLCLSVTGTFGMTEECGHEELIQCAKPLQVISGTSEWSFVTTKEELDNICPDLNAGLHCIRSYTRRCMSITQRTHFQKLYQGTSEVIHELCTDGGAYQRDFLRFAPCLRSIKSAYEDCARTYQATIEQLNRSLVAGPADHNNITTYEGFQSERVETVCCAFKNYVRCSEKTVEAYCGERPAQFTKKFLDKMASSLMSMHCDESSEKCGMGYNGSRTLTAPWTLLLVPFTWLMVKSFY